MPHTYVRKTSDIFISDKLRDLLTQFESESIVAQKLLHRRIDNSQLVEDFVNFISISDSDTSKISYLTTSRIEQIKNDPDVDYWTSKKRFHCKPGAFVSKIFNDISQKDVENFSTLFRAYSNKKEFEFKIVSGDEIRKYYYHEMHSSSGGSLGNSCMKYNRCQNYFDVYVNNPQVKLLIMTAPLSDLIVGRALLWSIDSTNIMDRIYTVQDEDYLPHFKKWAKDNGYLYKKYQNWGSTSLFESELGTIEVQIDIQLNSWNFNKYPYLDTFKWLDLKTGKLSNYKPDHFTNNTDRFLLLSNPDGEWYDCDYIKFDHIDRQWRYPGELICYDGQNYTTDRNLNYCETLDTWILKSESYYDDDIEDYIYTDRSRYDKFIYEARLKNIADRNSNDYSRSSIERLFSVSEILRMRRSVTEI
jgi:hypothetical protein